MKDSKKQEHNSVTRMLVCDGSYLRVLMVATDRSEELGISPSTCVRARFFFLFGSRGGGKKGDAH